MGTGLQATGSGSALTNRCPASRWQFSLFSKVLDSGVRTTRYKTLQRVADDLRRDH